MTCEIPHEKILQDRGFDICGKHVDTGTLYDKNGFDANGFDTNGFDKNGFDTTGFHIDTKTTWNIFGYDRKGHKFGEVTPKTLESTSTKTSQVITDDDDRQDQYNDDWDRNDGVDYDYDYDYDDDSWVYDESEEMVNCVSITYESEAETGFN